jgi:sucrose phosphorylase
MSTQTTRERVRYHLSRIYTDLGDEGLSTLADRILGAAHVEDQGVVPEFVLPGSNEVILITYADTFVADGQPHLRSLGKLWSEHFSDVFSTVHVLPFFPSSSDGGFAVVDYRQVDPSLGDWSDLSAVVGDRGLMVDLVCNHGSAQSECFADFVADREPGRSFYLTADPLEDLSLVTRPRTHPLLFEIETARGIESVWTTFSHDQVDFDFSNPDVLVEFCSILGFYLDQGATRVRLDAVAYLWKTIGTPCVHLPETHQVIKLMRALVEARDPSTLLITETNVPHGDNISYFGEGDEAHVVYNFTLAPLIVWSLVTGKGDTLTNWLGRLEPLPPGCTFLNFIASHDGIGLRPIEDLISQDQVAPMIDAAIAVGGDFSVYSAPGGPRPYELNVSLADLLAGTNGETSSRFVLAHALMLAVQGIPAIYVHSMLVSPGDIETASMTGHKRDINRASVPLDQARAALSEGWRAETFNSLAHLVRVRRRHPAFAPSAEQVVHVVHPQVVAIQRGTGAEMVLALHNVSAESVEFVVPDGFGTSDLISGEIMAPELTLEPWQARWLSTSLPVQ